MADTTTPKNFATTLPGSTSEEAIDLVQEVCEVTEAAATVVGGKEEKEKPTPPSSEKVTWGLDLGGDVGEDDKNGGGERGAEAAEPTDLSGGDEPSLTQVQDEAAQEGEDVTPDSPSASDTYSNSPPATLVAGSAGWDSSPRLSTPTPPSELLAESLEAPPGLEPPPSVTLLKSSTTTREVDEEVLPLETGLAGSGSLCLPNPFSSISLSHDDHDIQQQEHIEPPQYQQPPQRFEPLPPSQLLSATISHALSLTPPSQPRFSFQSHPKGQQNGPFFNFTYKPSSRDVISGIAPHVFDERRKRRSMSRGRRNSGRWLHRHSGGYDSDGCGSGYGGRPRASPLRRSVVISWGERSIYLEEATHAGTITSRVSIDISTGHERKVLSDSSSSSSSSSSSGESSCSPSSLSPPEKGTGKKLLGGASGKTGPKWSRKFKLFKNIVSRMKKRDPPAQVAH